MEPWTDRPPVDVRIGPHSEPEDVSDARLASTLDPLFQAGSDTHLSTIVKRCLCREDRPRRYRLHQDRTSVSWFGAGEEGGRGSTSL